MVKIYTKTGDRGTTSLFGGKRVGKDEARIEAYGNVDELNSLIGTILADNPPVDISKKLLRIQNELFVLGADLATPLDVKVKIPRIKKPDITRLEKETDTWDKDLPKLQKFILPGGGKVGAKLHLARTVTRRVERTIVSLASQHKINQNAQIYINRLSDWLFTLARYINHRQKVKAVPWQGRKIKGK